jgi:hypothetical protein
MPEPPYQWQESQRKLRLSFEERKIILKLSDEATFKLKCTGNHHNCVCIGLQKIHTFVLTRRSVYKDSLPGVDFHRGV